MPKFGAIIQARQNSTRLPNKTVRDLFGKPLISRVVEQVRFSQQTDEIIVATSEEKSDDLLESICKKHNINYFRGDLNNVLKRFIDTAIYFNIDVIIRITGDNPLTDPELIDELISMYIQNPDLDYINNVHLKGSVHGSGCELVTLAALKKSYKKISEGNVNRDYFEHVTLYIRKHPEEFTTEKYLPAKKLSRENISYSIDYPEDFNLVEIIYQNLYSDKYPIKTENVLNFLDKNPSLLEINSGLHNQLPDY